MWSSFLGRNKTSGLHASFSFTWMDGWVDARDERRYFLFYVYMVDRLCVVKKTSDIDHLSFGTHRHVRLMVELKGKQSLRFGSRAMISSSIQAS